VHHVNGDRSDNRPANLVICEDQSYHQLLHQRADPQRQRGTNNGNARLTREAVLVIRSRYADGETTLAALGTEFRVTKETIRKVVARETWAHIKDDTR
jgi:DNA-directed RNA polymerase sigma subunit (sigma70/sigma32)